MMAEKLRQNVLAHEEEKEERGEKQKWGAHSKFIICSIASKNRLEWKIELANS
jgi:hypothetical protein